MNSSRRMMKPIFGSLVLLLLSASFLLGGIPEKDKTQGLQKTNSNDLYRPFLINNVFNYYGNNGDGSYNKFSADNEGFEFYKGSGKHVIFEDGLVWGGYHKGRATAKVGGSVYKHALQAGAILTYGTASSNPVADNPSDPKYRVYRVRPDVNPNTPFASVEGKINSEEVAYINRYESYTAQQIYDQYIQDWNEWPAAMGAPFTYGKDGSGVQRTSGAYDPRYDIPGKKGSDQTLFYVANDCDQSRVNGLSGSPIIGLEMRRTIWGYKRNGALGSTIFMSSVVINKSGAPVDTMYFAQWADPDLGYAGDDFVGCDTTRSLGFVYNGAAVDAIYGTAVPAGGFTFFQGPKVAGAPTDSAVFLGRRVYGVKNLPMSAFVFFTQGNPNFADPTQGAGGDIEWYRLMKGTVAKTGSPFINPKTGLPSKFVMNGDPVRKTGWIDGDLPPADRRMAQVTGPFTLAPGDTQEVVVANVGGFGADYLSSVDVLKGVSDKAQIAYNNFFVLPSPPPSPAVTRSELNGTIILTWGDATELAKVEDFSDQGLAFEGYNVYEYSDLAATNKTLIGTYGLQTVPVIVDTVFDAASGQNIPTVVQAEAHSLTRELVIKSSKITGLPLVNGSHYYFAVSSFSYSSNPPATAGTHSLESSPTIYQVTPHSPDPGTRYASQSGDTLHVTLTTAAGASASDGFAVANVVDPTKTTGDQYAVNFYTDTTSGSPTQGETVWKITDVTKNKVVLSKWANQAGDANYPIVDGVSVVVSGPVPGMKRWGISGGNRVISPVGGFPGLGLEGFFSGGDSSETQDKANGTIGMAGNFAFGGISTNLTAAGYHNVLLRFAKVDEPGLWNPLVAPTDTNFSRGYRWLRNVGTATAPQDSTFTPWIIHKGSGYPYQDYNYSVPFSAWDLETTPPTRLAVGMFENNVVGATLDGRYWPPDTNGDNSVNREFAFIFASPYTTTPDANFVANGANLSGNASLPMMWVMVCARRGNAWAGGDGFKIFANHVNSAAHTYSFTAPANTVGNADVARADVTRINVFPNPYFGFNPQETSRYGRFVTFNHLPKKATIRIFNLAGILVRTMLKDDATTQYFQWDLNNESGFPVSAGVYVAYIDLPELGVTKTLKLSVIPEQQYLDRW